jgi:hypothetical protein
MASGFAAPMETVVAHLLGLFEGLEIACGRGALSKH